MANPVGMKAVADGIANLGVSEDPPGSNWGKWIKVYLDSVGIHSPAPWCAAFVNFRFQQAARELGEKCILPITGYCQTLYTWGEKQNRVYNLPQPGFIFLEWKASEGRYGHTGLVRSVQGTVFTTIEGNSNTNGSNEGYEVASNTRMISNVTPTQPRYKFLCAEPDHK